tara:strand:- start:17076 stop:17861 length:786 start_codon:yes stop_codon:yes gene_type:complete
MANVLQIKRNAYGSGGVPGSLANAELAYDGHNDILYIGKQTSNSPVTITPTALIRTASTSQIGMAKFNDLDFNVTNGEVTLETSSTAAELNRLDGASPGTVVANKAAIYGGSGELNVSSLEIGGTAVTATAAQLNRTTATAGTVAASKAVVVDSSKNITGFNNVTITGNLTVEGTTTTVDSDNLTVKDKNIVVASNISADPASAAGVNGAGLTIGTHGTAPTLTWINNDGTDRFQFNKPVRLTIAATVDTGSVLDFGIYQA